MSDTTAGIDDIRPASPNARATEVAERIMRGLSDRQGLDFYAFDSDVIGDIRNEIANCVGSYAPQPQTAEQAAEKAAQAFVGKDYSQAVMPQNRVVLQGLDSGDFVALGLGTADVSDSDGTVEFIQECAAEHILSAINSATEALQQENAELRGALHDHEQMLDQKDKENADLRNRLLNGDHDLMTLEECQESHREAGTHPTPCQICDGGLAYCKRCHGGEAELQESCADRLAKQNAELRRELDASRTHTQYLHDSMNRNATAYRREQKENADLREQLAKCRLIGWFDPGSKRFCYTDEKETWPDRRRGYTWPVYASPKELRRMAEQPSEAHERPEKENEDVS